MILWPLITLHILGATFWVGGMSFALLALRPSLPLLEPTQRLALHVAVLKRFFLIVWHAMPVMLLTGWAMVFLLFGGFAGAPIGIHVMQATGIAMAAVFLVIFFGPWKAVRAALDAGQGQEAAAGFDRIRRLVALNFLLGLVTIGAATWGG